MEKTTFAADLRQMMQDWDNATPAQRDAALAYAAKLAARAGRSDVPAEGK